MKGKYFLGLVLVGLFLLLLVNQNKLLQQGKLQGRRQEPKVLQRLPRKSLEWMQAQDLAFLLSRQR